MRVLLEDLERSFDLVIVDAPPLIPVTDSAVLAHQVGGVVLVVGAQAVRRQDLERSLNTLDMVGALKLGFVLNMLPATEAQAFGYSYSS
jgi:Mrp family chromosome partitioning ATPase